MGMSILLSRSFYRSVFIFSYPSKFISAQFQKFFANYNVSTWDVLPIIQDESQFLSLRAHLLGIPTIKQSQMAKTVASVELKQPQHKIATEDVQVKAVVVNEKQWKDQLIVHYTHERRLEPCKRDYHQCFDETFANTPAMDVKSIVGTRNSHNLKRELVQKRPKKSLLGKKDKSKSQI
jgi:hypothetical protein